MPSHPPTSLFILNEPARVLLVDDDPIFREFGSVHLSSPVATVKTAADGERGWDILKEETFDILLVDVDMPRLDGFSLVERVRADERLRHIPIIMVTGREDVLSIDRAYEVDATSFVTKPVNWRQFAYQVRYVLRSSRAEALARTARDRAEGLSKLKSSLLRMMGHEFRTPLNAILGFADMIRQGAHGPLEPRYSEYASFIGQAGARLLRMHVDMMNYAMLQSGEYTLEEAEYDLAELVKSAVAAARTPGGPAPSIEIEAQDGAIICDREQIVRMLQQLVENALRHGGGDVCVRAGVEPGGGITIEIADHGPGIAAERLAACLEPFLQGHLRFERERPGLGLGLPIARQIAELHGGALTVETSVGAGTTVRVTIPESRVLRQATAAA
jgi:signal transduction histidine kinase